MTRPVPEPAACPVAGHEPASSGRRANRPGEPSAPRVEHRDGVWFLRAMGPARQLLRARHATTQAGFTAEHIPSGGLRHRPILFSDGPLHDEQRSKVARFLAPAVVTERHSNLIASVADRLVAEARETGRVRLDEMALHFTVEVTAEIVGLTHDRPGDTEERRQARIRAMSRRLVAFFNQPPFDLTRPDLGRGKLQWMQAAHRGLGPVVTFGLADVLPAVRQRRREPAGDIMSHLVAEGYSPADLLIEAVTYGTAGMVTTREFIAMAAWHLLTDNALRTRYVDATEDERHALLHELIRLEPVVGHLYRRVTEPVEITDEGQAWTLQPGDLVDVCTRSANADEGAVGPQPLQACPGRARGQGVPAAGLAFGDGAHKCPGQPLAILEADALLTRLLAADATLVTEPRLGWDDLIAGYWLREMELELDPPSGPMTTATTPTTTTKDATMTPPAHDPGDRAAVAAGFDQAAARYDLMVSFNPGYRRHLRRAADALLDQVDDPVPTLLDLGCGSGLSTRELLKACRRRGITPRIIGVDASSGMLARARARTWPQCVVFVEGRAEELDQLGLPEADGAMACYLLRNVTDVDETLDQIAGVLRPGGVLVAEDYSVRADAGARRRWNRVNCMIITPLARVLTGDAALYEYLHGSVDDFSTPAELAATMTEHGYRDVATRTVPGWQNGILHLWRARTIG